MSTIYCGCDPSHAPEPWYCEEHRNQGSGGFCPCTEGAPCPDKVTPPPATTYQPIPGVMVFGLGHKARHGKDSAAQVLIETYPEYVKRYSFADAVRTYCRIEHGMTTKDAPLLQRVGVEMRERRSNVWIDTVYWSMVDNAPANHPITGTHQIAIITDVRFQNEADFVKALGGEMIKVERRDQYGTLFQAQDRDPNHISECDLSDYPWDHTLVATDLASLRDRAKKLFRAILFARAVGGK